MKTVSQECAEIRKKSKSHEDNEMDTQEYSEAGDN